MPADWRDLTTDSVVAGQRAGFPLGTQTPQPIRATLLGDWRCPGISLLATGEMAESTYARELAPLAGHCPCLRLGPPWWFHDSPEGMKRFRRATTETAGFYNTVGFNDDTRAFLSIPACHDVARRIDCGFLAELVAEHRMEVGGRRTGARSGV